MRFVQPLHQRITSRFRLKAFLLGALLSFIFIGIGSLLWIQQALKDVIIPGVSVDGIDLSYKTPLEAQQLLVQNTPTFSHTITLTSESSSIASSAAQLGLEKDIQSSIGTAISYGHTQGFLENTRILWHSYTSGYQITTTLQYDTEKVRSFVTEFERQTNKAPRSPSTELEGKQILVFPGELGIEVDRETTIQAVLRTAATTNSLTIPATVTKVGSVLTEEQQTQAVARATTLIGKSIHATSNDQTFFFDDDQLIALLNHPAGYNSQASLKMLEELRTKIDRPSTDAVFDYDPATLTVTRFEPDKDGLTINIMETNAQINQAIQQLENSDETVVTTSLIVQAKPANKKLGDTNPLGINERIGFGESNYRGSISSRVHNVSQASNILNYRIVKPGEEFSFNKALGDVSQATGFKPAYVIKSGQTVLGDGGGVCQVSTTLFRALLDSGLNISKRKPHSYRVGYYEQQGRIGDYSFADLPGFDATVYSGDVDVRFINDSPGHVLIHFEVDPSTQHMTVSMYGTSDGRTAEVSDYKKWDARKAPAAQYIDDPSLPPGKLVQIDWAVAGIRSSFKHTVKDKNGNILREDTYSSNYIPWAAKYRRGV